MQNLPAEVQAEFLLGNHVMRHNAGIWNGIWSDMYIETTFMRYGHGPGGIIGNTLEPGTLTRWALNLHICSRLIKDVTSLTDDPNSDVITHKEEMNSRIKSDNLDREKIRLKLQTSIDPFATTNHPSNVVNIVTGQIAPENVNVDQSVLIGEQLRKEYESSWPEGFYQVIPRRVITMSVTKRQIKVDKMSVYDTELIYSRVIGLQSSRDISMKDVLEYELSPVPTSLFEDSGEMRTPKAKSTLKRKLQVDAESVGVRTCVILDGCAILWVIHWPTTGTVADYVKNFVAYIQRLLHCTDVYLVFDRYYKPSIKGETRLSRAGKTAVRQHILNASTELPSQKVTLCVTENKVQLIDIICQYLMDHASELPQENKLVVTYKHPVPFQIVHGEISQRNDLRTTHEEADIIIVQQMVRVGLDETQNIEVICDDTDVFILLLFFYAQQQLTCGVTMRSTNSSHMKILDVQATVNENKDIVNQLLPAHALSGCDTVSQLYGIGKGTVLRILKSGRTLSNLGMISASMSDVIEEATSFISACYGSSDAVNMSDARFSTWTSKMANKKLKSAPLLKTLPPTTESFEEHVYRAHLQTALWRAALEPDPPALNPVDYGWTLDEVNQFYEPVLLPLDVSPAPLDVLQLIKCGCASEHPCGSARCSCYAARLSCSMFCSCHGEHCYNVNNVNGITQDNQDDNDLTAVDENINTDD